MKQNQNGTFGVSEIEDSFSRSFGRKGQSHVLKLDIPNTDPDKFFGSPGPIRDRKSFATIAID